MQRERDIREDIKREGRRKGGGGTELDRETRSREGAGKEAQKMFSFQQYSEFYSQAAV
jgi:hypothetical protein